MEEKSVFSQHVKLITAVDEADFEIRVNYWLDSIDEKGFVANDIKFTYGLDDTFRKFSALIIYSPKYIRR
jgi:hypothetical protein